MKALTEYERLTKTQKELIARAQEELMIDDITSNRMEEAIHRRLLSAIRHIRTGLRDNMPGIIIDSQFRVLTNALKPYDKWRKKYIKGAGNGIDEDHLSDAQKEALRRAKNLTDFCIGPPSSDLIEFYFLLGALDQYNFWKDEPLCYTDEFIERLIQNIHVCSKALASQMADNMIHAIFDTNDED